MLEIGSIAPDFTLKNQAGEEDVYKRQTYNCVRKLLNG